MGWTYDPDKTSAAEAIFSEIHAEYLAFQVVRRVSGFEVFQESELKETLATKRKILHNFEQHTWLEMLTSRDAECACFKGSGVRTSCDVVISGVFPDIFGRNRWHHVMEMLPVDHMIVHCAIYGPIKPKVLRVQLAPLSSTFTSLSFRTLGLKLRLALR